LSLINHFDSVGRRPRRSGKQKTLSHDEKGRQKLLALLIFPKPMAPGLDLAPDVEIVFNRLPWCHRASPSTTRHETVLSTDADKLIYPVPAVNQFFRENRLTDGLGRRIRIMIWSSKSN
jgi:hypothetical protein